MQNFYFKFADIKILFLNPETSWKIVRGVSHLASEGHWDTPACSTRPGRNPDGCFFPFYKNLLIGFEKIRWFWD